MSSIKTEVVIPDVLYRGYAAADPWTSRRGLPTFTDVKQVAAEYAKSNKGRVHRFQVSIKKPFILGDLNEDVVTIGQLRSNLALFSNELEIIIEELNKNGIWRSDGEWIDLNKVDLQHECYTDTYRIADSLKLAALAARAGFDGFAYRATYTGEFDLTLPLGSLDTDTFSIMEYRPFKADQIKFI